MDLPITPLGSKFFHVRDSKWLTLDVCPTTEDGHDENSCRLAHTRGTERLDDDGKVIVCFDYIKKTRCAYINCRYFHPPMHLCRIVLEQGNQTRSNIPSAVPLFSGSLDQILLFQNNSDDQLTGISHNFTDHSLSNIAKENTMLSTLSCPLGSNSNNNPNNQTINNIFTHILNEEVGTSQLPPVMGNPQSLDHYMDNHNNCEVSIATIAKKSSEKMLHRKRKISTPPVRPDDGDLLGSLEDSKKTLTGSPTTSSSLGLPSTSGGEASSAPSEDVDMGGKGGVDLSAFVPSHNTSHNNSNSQATRNILQEDPSLYTNLLNNIQLGNIAMGYSPNQFTQKMNNDPTASAVQRLMYPCNGMPNNVLLNGTTPVGNILEQQILLNLINQSALESSCTAQQNNLLQMLFQNTPTSTDLNGLPPVFPHQHVGGQQAPTNNNRLNSALFQNPLLPPTTPTSPNNNPSPQTQPSQSPNQGVLGFQNNIYPNFYPTTSPNSTANQSLNSLFMYDQLLTASQSGIYAPLGHCGLPSASSPAFTHQQNLLYSSLQLFQQSNYFMTNVAYMNEKGQILDSLPICRDFKSGKCHRGTECRYVHLVNDNVEINQGRVTVCRDAAKGRCIRQPCKYFHIPIAAINASRGLALANSQMMTNQESGYPTSFLLNHHSQPYGNHIRGPLANRGLLTASMNNENKPSF